MTLISTLPVTQVGPWSATAPVRALELITTYNLDEHLALLKPPHDDVRWAAEAGTHTSVGVGIIKPAFAMPQSAAMQPFNAENGRRYYGLDVITQTLKPGARDLSYKIPMIWNEIGNGYQLMAGGRPLEIADITGIAELFVMSGAVERAVFAADLFYSSFYATTGGLSSTAPTKLTYPQGAATGGIALFSDGTGAAGSVGDQHYANPTNPKSGRFSTVHFGYGPWSQNTFASSMTLMAKRPHPLFPNITSGQVVTDVFGPTSMRQKFFEMAVQDLVLQAVNMSGQNVAAAVTNPYSFAKANGLTEETFIGNPFGPRRYWAIPHLDNHPYLVQNPTADFWINIARNVPGRAQSAVSWCKLACNTKDWTPVFRMYGPGDPIAQRDREMRWEGDLDADSQPGDPMAVDMFGSV